MSLIHKLLQVQKDLKAPKGQKNTFGNYNYRSAEDILEAVKPLNVENDLLLTLSDEPEIVGTYQYIKATATLTDGESTIIVTAYARESQSKKGMDDSQNTGTASSYARKYALNGLYLIDDTKDADSDEYQNQKGKQPDPANPNSNLISAEQMAALVAKVENVAKANQQDKAAVYQSAASHFKLKKTANQLTKGEAAKIIDYLATLEG